MKKTVVAVSISLILIYCVKVNPDLGGGYKILYSGGGPFFIITNPQNSVIVNEHVLDFVFDSIYIIAAQRPFDSVPECVEEGYIYTDCRRAVLKTSTFRQYWIIDKTKESVFISEEKKHSNVFGPFNKEQYLLKRKELNIPESLVLNVHLQ